MRYFNVKPASVALILVLGALLVLMSGCGGGSPQTQSTTTTSNGAVTPTFAKDEPDFTIVTLPDTQFYAHFPAWRPIFQAQADWIAANKQALNIVAVLGLGDIVDCGSSDPVQWQVANAAYTTVENTGIPFVPLVGNHDLGIDCRGIAGPPRDGTNFNNNFGPQRMQKYSWYGTSTYPSGSNENYYVKIDLEKRKYLVVAMEFKPRPEAVQWASSVISQFPEREVIVTTHALLNPDGSWAGEGNDLWSTLLKKFPNVVMATCGHMLGESRRTDTGDHGNVVQSILSDYQSDPNGGNGFLRIMKFRPSAGVIEVHSYSPSLGQFRTEPENEFTLPYK
jgi:hypothetical protein